MACVAVKLVAEPPVVTARLTVAPAQLTTCASKSTVRVQVVAADDCENCRLVAEVSRPVKKCSPSLSAPSVRWLKSTKLLPSGAFVSVTLTGIEFAELKRPDECCGFGGTFAVDEEAVSCMMGLDRLHDHTQAGTCVLTAGDMSCLMHLQGLITRKKLPIQVMHVAEILAGDQPAPARG